MRFFTGSSSLAINSLPADAVERFEFIDNYSQSRIYDDDSDDLVLNIGLKEEKKRLVFGDVLLNGNSVDRYKVGANLFYYSPENQLNFIYLI